MEPIDVTFQLKQYTPKPCFFFGARFFPIAGQEVVTTVTTFATDTEYEYRFAFR